MCWGLTFEGTGAFCRWKGGHNNDNKISYFAKENERKKEKLPMSAANTSSPGPCTSQPLPLDSIRRPVKGKKSTNVGFLLKGRRRRRKRRKEEYVVGNGNLLQSIPKSA